MRCTALLLCLLAPVCATSCATARPKTLTQNAVIAVMDDRGAPIRGAAIVHDGKAVAKTAADGATEVRVAGHDGDAFPFKVECPIGFDAASPGEIHLVVRPGVAAATPRFDSQCARSTRKIAIEIKTSVALKNAKGESLPILYLGQEIGRTDPTGIARVELETKSGEDLDLVIDTRGSKHRLHPAMPTLTIKGTELHDAVTVEQPFTVEKPQPIRFAPRAPQGPRVIG
jgi:hypothetical protein